MVVIVVIVVIVAIVAMVVMVAVVVGVAELYPIIYANFLNPGNPKIHTPECFQGTNFQG